MDAPEQLSTVLGSEHVLGGLCRISTYTGEPGVIKHVGVPPHIAFGEMGNKKSERGLQLVDIFFSNLKGVSAQIPDDIHKTMWEKFVFIAAVSGVGAVTSQSNGVIRSLPETREMKARAMDEVVVVSQANGVILDKDTATRMMEAVVDRTPERTIPSMQKDILEGRRLELEAQNGAVVSWGREKGIPTPVNEFIYASLLPMELAAHKKI